MRLRDIADVVLGAEDYDTEVRFTGQTAVFIGIWALPNANSLDVIKRVRAEMAAIQKELPEQIKARIAYDAHQVHPERHPRSGARPCGDTLLIVVVVIFLFLGSFRSVLVPVVAIPVSLIGAVFLMQVFGFTLNLLTLLAIVLSVGLVVDDAIVVVENVERHLREGQSPLEAALVGARELVGPIIAMTITLAAVYAPDRLAGRPDRLAVPRVRAHPGRRGDHLRRRRADPVAGDVAPRCCTPAARSTGFAGIDQPRLRAPPAGLRPRARRGAAQPRPAVYTVWVVLTVLAVLMFMQSAKELAPAEDQGVIFGIVDAPANSTLDQLARLDARGQRGGDADPRDEVHLPDHLPQRRLLGRGAQAVGRAQAHRLPDAARGAAEASRRSPGSRPSPVLPPALPGGGNFPVEFVIASTAETERDPRVRQAAAAEGRGERDVRLPAADRREDRPAAVGDRHRPRQGGRSWASTSQQVGAGPRRRRWAATSSTASASRPELQGHSPAPARPSGSTPSSWRTSTSPARTAS